MAAQRLEGGVGLLGGNDRQELAFVGDVQRIDSEQVAGPGDRGIDGQGGLVQDHGEAGVVGELVADRPDAAPGRVPQPASRRGGREQRLDELGHGGGVGPDVRLESQVASRQHHRHPVVGNGAGDEDAIAALDAIGAQPPAGRDDADPGRCHVQPVGCAPADDLGVTGDDRHTGRGGRLGHVGDDLAELVDRRSPPRDERGREPVRPGAHHGEVVDRPVDGEVTDRSARETERLHHERIGGERQRLAVGQSDECRIGQRAVAPDR